MPRFREIDTLRAVAIIMMVIFHFAWNLNYFGVIDENLYSGFWGIFQKITAFLFLFLAGTGIALHRQKYPEKFYSSLPRRGVFIFAVAMLITLFTLIFFPSQFIYFGILHLIGLSTILSVLFADKKIPGALAGLAIIAIPLIYNISSLQITPLVWAGFATPFATLDYYPLIPWFGIILLGIAAGNVFYFKEKRNFLLPEKMNGPNFLQFLGRNSLAIYLSHQFILFPIAYFISLIL